MRGGFVYLTAVIDWYSRYVLAFELSNTLDTAFCIRALRAALEIAQPEIFNFVIGFIAQQRLTPEPHLLTIMPGVQKPHALAQCHQIKVYN